MAVLTPLLAVLLYLAGIFTLTLGIVHFFFPVLLDFRHAIPLDGPPLKMFRLWPIYYQTKRRDVYGIAWAMNHASSYVLVTIGLLDLTWTIWQPTGWGRVLMVWIAGWWLIRTASHLYLGHRTGDLLTMMGFAGLAITHILAAFM